MCARRRNRTRTSAQKATEASRQIQPARQTSDRGANENPPASCFVRVRSAPRCDSAARRGDDFQCQNQEHELHGRRVHADRRQRQSQRRRPHEHACVLGRDGEIECQRARYRHSRPAHLGEFPSPDAGCLRIDPCASDRRRRRHGRRRARRPPSRSPSGGSGHRPRAVRRAHAGSRAQPSGAGRPGRAAHGRERRATGTRAAARCPSRRPGTRTARPGCSPGPWTRRTGASGDGSEDRQHPVALEGGDLGAVLPPLGALVAQEEVEDVLAERLGEELGVLGDADRL